MYIVFFVHGCVYIIIMMYIHVNIILYICTLLSSLPFTHPFSLRTAPLSPLFYSSYLISLQIRLIFLGLAKALSLIIFAPLPFASS